AVAAAVFLATCWRRSKLIVFPGHGRMARYVSTLRPDRAPIFAFTSSDKVCRQLVLCWGTVPARIDFTEDSHETSATAEKFLRKNKSIAPDDHLVVITDILMGEALIDSIQLRVVK